jgi:starch synthase
MRIVVIGTRGIPNVQGGVETHCQQLFPRLAEKGYKVTVFARKNYVKDKKPHDYRGVKIIPSYAFPSVGLETISHGLRCLLAIIKSKPDIVHIHGIGSALFTPIFRLFRLKVVYTHHGQDYKRAKWGQCAKIMLRLGEFLGTLFATKIIVISEYLNNFLKTRYKSNKTVLIHNGVEVNTAEIPDEKELLNNFGLKPNQYILACGRFVKEKGFHDLIQAYIKLPENLKNGYKLVIAGAADHETPYSKGLIENAKKANAVLTGFIGGGTLQAVQRNARLFILPSYHEGLPIALLEALSYNLDIIASDIPANTEVPLPKECFTPVGNVDALAQKIEGHLLQKTQQDFHQIIHDHYNWDTIAEQTADVYRHIMGK